MKQPPNGGQFGTNQRARPIAGLCTGFLSQRTKQPNVRFRLGGALCEERKTKTTTRRLITRSRHSRALRVRELEPEKNEIG